MKSGFYWFILFQNWISTQSHIILGNTNAIFIVTFRGQEGFLAKYLVVLTSEDQPNIEVIHYIFSIQNITYIYWYGNLISEQITDFGEWHPAD